MVFCRETGWKEDEEDVEALEAGWSIVATDIVNVGVVAIYIQDLGNCAWEDQTFF